MLSDLMYRLRVLLRRRTAEQELKDELEFHLEHQAHKYVAAGLTHADAARRARLDFGGVDQVADACRDARGIGLIDTTLQDIRYGLRGMRRRPTLALMAIVTIALGTAAIGAEASLADTLLWRHWRADDADSLVSIGAIRGGSRTDGAVSYPDYVAFRDRATTVSALAAHYSTAPLFVAVNGTAREVNGAVVSANYFPLFEMHPALGRFFGPEEDRVPDRDHVVVVGYDFWQSWLGAAPSAPGSALTINGVAFTIIGVAPRHPVGLTPLPVDLYIPTMMLRVGYRWCRDSLAGDCTTLGMVGRLVPGRTVADAQAEFAAIVPPAWRSAPPGENRGVAVRRPRGMSDDDQESRLVAVLGGVAVVLLLVCCANLGGLLSAQSAARENEFAIRVSLGAGPGRIVRQVVTESLMLALAGGAGGLVLSRFFVAALARMFFSMDDEGHPLFYDFSPSSTIVLATIAAAALAGILFSVLPAIRAVRRPRTAHTARRTVSARWSTGRALLGAQAAAAVALVATSALLGSSARLVLTGRNYDTAHVALMRVRPRLVKYTPERAQRFQREALQRLRAVPSVESVSMVGVGAVLGGGSTTATLPGSSAARLTVKYNEVGPAYFATLRTPMVAGREFDDHDTRDSTAVAVVNQALANRLWPDGRAIGSTIVIGNTPRQIVGIVADLAMTARTQPADLWAYTPFWQNPGQIDSRIAVRTAGDPESWLPELARAVHQVDPDVPIAETITLPMRMAGLTRPIRVGAVFIGYAACLAMLLTAIGLYGALAFAVSRRTKEIGIRLALGAARAGLIASIVREGVTVVLAGASVGIVLAVAGSRVMSHLLYGSPSDDWKFYAAAASVVVAIGALAALLPARRAAAVEPSIALRQE
ncbi:MAG TPA: ADOP family duplicated permease [Vicinamibacterales bacterium]|nr:ADOP family duplicated permease [Vicinamibacterales bacterium]